jgi:hypothetical protein
VFCIQNSYCVGEAGKTASSNTSGPHAGTSSEASHNHEKEEFSSSAESSDSSSDVSVHDSLTLLNSTCKIIIHKSRVNVQLMCCLVGPIPQTQDRQNWRGPLGLGWLHPADTGNIHIG